MIELPKNYDHAKVERRVSAWWKQQDVFRGPLEAGADPFCLAMPPPNLSGPLHMGHALNQTLQDVLARWQRMKGRDVLWVPGTDHAGIETECSLRRMLSDEGVDAREIERESFIERVAAWAATQDGVIREQLLRLGMSCDWSRARFTMDPAYCRAAAEWFVRLYEKGLVYRGESVVNICPRCGTALSEGESETRELDGILYVIRFSLKGGRKKDAVLVATARPELLPGVTAVAVNPRDERVRRLSGKKLLLPLLGREVPVIEDDSVDPESGTGAVMLTPSHRQIDFEIARRHDLPLLHAIERDGAMSEAAGAYAGQNVRECRKNLLDDLRHAGLLEEELPHRHLVLHCCHCLEVLEPRLSSQWFVKMKPLARPAIDAVKQAKVRFVPERWNKVFLDRMETIRDWCISRQIRWGHPIPVFICGACAHEWAATTRPEACPLCGVPEPRQASDVLDSWFSAALWPFAALGWPEQTPDLQRYYPTDTLVTAPEILFFWVARMIVAGIECTGETPFSRVYIHGTVRDEAGRKMSRRLDNGVDPREPVRTFGADAVRLSLAMDAVTGQDLQLSDEKTQQARAFAATLWTVARFMRTHEVVPDELADEPDFDKERLTPDDKHLLAKLHDTLAACEEALERCRLHDYAKAIRDFLQRRYCDWYVDYAREVFRAGNETGKAQVRKVMQYTFSLALRCLHPLMPFLTEELWHGMGYSDHCSSIVRAPWPRAMEEEQLAADWGVTPAMVNYVDARQDLISVGRALRADYEIKSGQPVEFVIRPSRDRDEKRLRADAEAIATLLKARRVTVDADFSPPRTMPSALSQLGALYMPLEGLVDRAAEVARLREQAGKVSGQLRRINRKLENMDFLGKAPSQVVEAERTRKKELLEKHEKLRKMIETLSDGETK